MRRLPRPALLSFLAVWTAAGAARALPPRGEAEAAGAGSESGGEVEASPEAEEEGGEGEALEERTTPAGRDETEPTRAEQRLVDSLGLGTPAIVHRLTAPGGVTPRFLRAAGGERRPSYLSYPIPGGRLARGFGSGTNGRHKALDVIAEEGTSIRAAERGLVVYADDTIRGYGWMVVLLHPGGWVTFYAHCKKLLVHPGQTVDRRQVIAKVGDTGIARGHHLHFTLFIHGAVSDPYPFFRPPPPNLPHVGPLPHRGHRVREDETLEQVAEQFDVDVVVLRAANGLEETDTIQAGWQLLIPGQLEAPPEVDDGPSRTYAVRQGDTLSEIAQRFGTTTAVIREMNRLGADEVIRVGQELKIPGGGGGDGDESTRPDTQASRMHTVAQGETLTRIARRYHVTVRAIMQANRIREATDVRVGQDLVIPETGGGDSGGDDGDSGGGTTRSRRYTVKQGDTLFEIARQFNTSIRTLRNMNPALRENDDLRPGDVVEVPIEE